MSPSLANERKHEALNSEITGGLCRDYRMIKAFHKFFERSVYQQVKELFRNKYENKLSRGFSCTALLSRRNSMEREGCPSTLLGVRTSWCNLRLMQTWSWRTNICYCSVHWSSLDVFTVRISYLLIIQHDNLSTKAYLFCTSEISAVVHLQCL